METATWELLFKLGPVTALMGVALYVLYRLYLSERKENKKLNGLLIETVTDNFEKLAHAAKVFEEIVQELKAERRRN